MPPTLKPENQEFPAANKSEILATIPEPQETQMQTLIDIEGKKSSSQHANTAGSPTPLSANRTPLETYANFLLKSSRKPTPRPLD